MQPPTPTTKQPVKHLPWNRARIYPCQHQTSPNPQREASTSPSAFAAPAPKIPRIACTGINLPGSNRRGCPILSTHFVEWVGTTNVHESLPLLLPLPFWVIPLRGNLLLPLPLPSITPKAISNATATPDHKTPHRTSALEQSKDSSVPTLFQTKSPNEMPP